jgi:hypothetical protein
VSSLVAGSHALTGLVVRIMCDASDSRCDRRRSDVHLKIAAVRQHPMTEM